MFTAVTTHAKNNCKTINPKVKALRYRKLTYQIKLLHGLPCNASDPNRRQQLLSKKFNEKQTLKRDLQIVQNHNFVDHLNSASLNKISNWPAKERRQKCKEDLILKKREKAAKEKAKAEADAEERVRPRKAGFLKDHER